MEYKCKKHKSNKGYYDSNGQWHCWQCTKENKYFYPDGKIVSRIRIGDKEVRIVKTEEEHNIKVETWDVKKLKLENVSTHCYMSTATREYKEIIKQLELKGSNHLIHSGITNKIIIFNKLRIPDLQFIKSKIESRDDYIYFNKCEFLFPDWIEIVAEYYTREIGCTENGALLTDSVLEDWEIQLLEQYNGMAPGVYKVDIL